MGEGGRRKSTGVYVYDQKEKGREDYTGKELKVNSMKGEGEREKSCARAKEVLRWGMLKQNGKDGGNIYRVKGRKMFGRGLRVV